jgi:retron-type reverse transcriptase
MSGAPKPNNISTKQDRIAKLAQQMPGTALRTLAHHIDVEWLTEAHRRTRKDAAPGVDGVTAEAYERDLEGNLDRLLGAAKTGQYRAPPVRRVEIPKSDGKTRPLGIPTHEDKVLQRAVAMVLEPIYESEFYDFSYGFRPGRSAHQALEALWRGLMNKRIGWVLDVDVQSFFDTLDHQLCRDLLSKRVSDGVIVRLVGKWLNAGVLEGGVVRRSAAGTPQGGVISPLLANIYLHEVLDRWWVEDVLPRMRGEAFLIRYADDCAPRRREGEVDETDLCSLAAREMGGGPPRSDDRVRSQTTGRCLGTTAWVVSGHGKGGTTRQVWIGKANASEPPTKCRKRRDVIETGLQLLVRDRARRAPVFCPSGDRHKGGASPIQALVRNVGTFRLDVKGEPASGRTTRGRVPMRGEGADRPVVAPRPSNAGGAKGSTCPAEHVGQPARGGAHG